jgi:hypothetical protein
MAMEGLDRQEVHETLSLDVNIVNAVNVVNTVNAVNVVNVVNAATLKG